MKHSKLLLSMIFTMALVPAAFAGSKKAAQNEDVNVSEDVDGLGGNEDLMKMAQNLKSESRTRIVQDRVVDRHNAFEFGLSYGGVFGGDTYVSTQSLGLSADFHINPRWSVGVHYLNFTNSLTPEGQRAFNNFRAAEAAGAPATAVDVDYPQSATMAVINWYPIYGKTSFLDMGITQFDLYFLAGAGQIQLSHDSSAMYDAGIGVGAWITKHLSLRAELKYQTYNDEPVGVSGNRHLDTVAGTFGLGWIL